MADLKHPLTRNKTPASHRNDGLYADRNVERERTTLYLRISLIHTRLLRQGTAIQAIQVTEAQAIPTRHFRKELLMQTPRHSKSKPVNANDNWTTHLVSIINANKTRHAFKDKTVSTRSMDNRHQTLFQSFKELRDECGFKIENPRNFREAHFKVLANLWASKGLKASTMQGKTTVLRVFCKWIGRPNMIKSLEHYIDVSLVKRTQVAQVDKSWKGNGVSYEDILKKVDAYDERACAQMRIIKAFGLRREEAVCFQPIRAMKLGEDKQSIFVEKGTKNGLKRYVPIDSDEKREALAFACAVRIPAKPASDYGANPPLITYQTRHPLQRKPCQ